MRVITPITRVAGLERLKALHGYPLQGYAGLRNIFEQPPNNIRSPTGHGRFLRDQRALSRASLSTLRKVRKLRKKTERWISVSLWREQKAASPKPRLTSYFGALGPHVCSFETHGARLSFANAQDFLKGQGRRPLKPQFNERNFAIFMNRYCEIAWMTHRLIPLIQPPTGVPFDGAVERQVAADR